MVEAIDVMNWGAKSSLKTRVLVGALHMLEASGVRSWGATRVLEARRVIAEHMVEASAARS